MLRTLATIAALGGLLYVGAPYWGEQARVRRAADAWASRQRSSDGSTAVVERLEPGIPGFYLATMRGSDGSRGVVIFTAAGEHVGNQITQR